MERVRKFLSAEVALSVIIPIIISLFSYVAAQAKYTERLAVVEKRIEMVDTYGTTKLNTHLIEDTRSSEQLMAEIKVLQSKVDQIRSDLQDMKKK